MKLKLVSSILFLFAITLTWAAELAPPPATGAAAPEVSLTSGDGRAVNLKDYRGKWIVLYFYPKDFTGGCTLEAHNFQRDLAKYDALHAVVLGVSVDSAESHKKLLRQGRFELQAPRRYRRKGVDRVRLSHGLQRNEDGGAKHLHHRPKR